MATRWCPACGSEYVETATMCAECDVDLVDEPPVAAGDERLGEGDQVAYDLVQWDAEDRVMLDNLLTSQGVAHVWEVATLVVRREDEGRVDALLDDLDAEEEVEELDPDQSQLEYELEGWTHEQREELDVALEQAGIPHAWDEETLALVVHEADEEQVERLLDAVEFPDAIEADGEGEPGEVDGIEAQEVMSALFVAADRLLHDPSDADGVLAAVDGADRVAAMRAPFGFSDEDWQALVDEAAALKGALEGDADDEVVVERATALRTTLRRYV